MALCYVSPRKLMQTPNISILLDLCLSISFFELSMSKVHFPGKLGVLHLHHIKTGTSQIC